MSDALDANSLVTGAMIALVGSLVLLLQLLTAASLLPPLWLAGIPIVGFSLLLGTVFVVDRLSTATPTEDVSEELATDGGTTDSSPGKGRFD